MQSKHAFLICLGLVSSSLVSAQSIRQQCILPDEGNTVSLFFPYKFYTSFQNVGSADYYPPIVDVCGHLDGGSKGITWHFDTFDVHNILTIYTSAAFSPFDTVRRYPIPPSGTIQIDYKMTIADEIPQVLQQMEEGGYGSLIPRAYFNIDGTISSEQLDSIDNALDVLFLDKLKGISLINGKKRIYYPIDKTDSSAMRILLRTQRNGNFRLHSDSMFIYQQLYDIGNVPLDSVAALLIDQCCTGTDIWAWKQLDVLLADAYQDIVIDKNLKSVDAYRDKMAAIAAAANSDRVTGVYNHCRYQLELYYRIIRDFGEW